MPAMRLLLAMLVLFAAVPAAADVLKEPLGPVRHFMTEAQVKKAAGAPTATGEPYYAGEATADWQKDWQYGDATVTFYGDTKTGPKWILRTIHVSGTSRWKTKRGIGVGATRARVEKTYAKTKDKESSNDEHLVAGSVYGGILFTFEAGTVKSIFVGASAF